MNAGNNTEECRELLLKITNTENKVERKRAVLKLREGLERCSNAKDLEEEALPTLYRCLDDSVEMCRESAALILAENFIEAATLHYVVPIVRKRLVETGEPSEEVRLAFLNLTVATVGSDKNEGDLKLCMDELREIAMSAVQDPYLEVKLSGCRLLCVLEPPACEKSSYRMTLASSPSLTNALAKNLTHQQKRVRVAAVEALERLLCATASSETFTAAVPHLAQRHFDPMPEVRIAVCRLAARMMMEWECRASNFPLLVPLLVTGLEDEMPFNSDETFQLWSQVGDQFLSEAAARDKQVKEQLDFPADPPTHYPGLTRPRPGFGCRLLVQRIFHKLREAIERDLRDWRSETRVKTAQLLSVLVLHLEHEAVGHADHILARLQMGALDAEENVVVYICRAANYFGHFVLPKYWISIVFQRLQDNPNRHELRVLANILQGSHPDSLAYHLEDMGLALQADNMCLLRNDDHLREVLSCCRALATVCEKNIHRAEATMFRAGITILALAQCAELKGSARSFLEALSASLGLSSLPDLFKRQMSPVLKGYRSECGEWGPASPEPAVLAAMLRECKWAAGFHAELLVSLFRQALTEESPPELKIKLLLIMAQQMAEVEGTVNSQKQFGQYSKIVITDLLLPHLKWHPGKKAQAVRTAAASCLWSLLSSSTGEAKENEGAAGSAAISAEQLLEVTQALLPSMNGLVEDGADQVRIFICRSIRAYLDIVGDRCPRTALLNTCKNVLRRLDDKEDTVRALCLDIVSAVPRCISSEDVGLPEAQAFVEHASKMILLHADDSDEDIRKKCIETLKTLSPLCPSALRDLAADSGRSHRHKEEIDDLVAHLDKIVVSSC